jgi:hypothetical protein
MRFWLAILVCIVLSQPTLAAGTDLSSSALDDVVDVLHERGLIDGDERDRILLKHRAQVATAPPDVPAPLQGLEWSGDLRLRFEYFDYDTDPLGMSTQDRSRFRYRARIGFQKQINDWLRVGVRLGSGEDAQPRSEGRSLGSDEDFDADPVFFDRAWMQFKLCDCGSLDSRLWVGKLPNHFRWKYGVDSIVWDADISPEGMMLDTTYEPSEQTRLFSTVAYFINHENAGSKDPKLLAAQVGGTHQLTEGLELGLRGSWYEWRALDDTFIASATSWGNLTSAFDGKARIAEVSSFLGFSPHPQWPSRVFGTFVHNFTADKETLAGWRTDDESDAYSFGIETGAADRIATVGWSYVYAEANSTIAQFIDSPTFDGFTNREGWIFYVRRNLAPRVQLRLKLMDMDAIRTTGGAAGPFVESLASSDRRRLQTDLFVSF